MVIAIIAIIAALLFPVLSAAKDRAREAACLNNLKQLDAGSIVYNDDNASKFTDNQPLAYFVANPTNPAVGLPANSSNNWVLGNMMIPTDATNTALIQRGELFPYTTQTALYRCPSDTYQANGIFHVRSYSMNSWIGSRYMNQGIGTLSAEPGYRTFVTENETAFMGTANLWVIADEHELTINDPWWLVTMDDSHPFVDFPATRHARGYNLAFADGHVERYALSDPYTASPTVPVAPTNSDWNVLKQVTTIR